MFLLKENSMPDVERYTRTSQALKRNQFVYWSGVSCRPKAGTDTISMRDVIHEAGKLVHVHQDVKSNEDQNPCNSRVRHGRERCPSSRCWHSPKTYENAIKLENEYFFI